MGINVLAVFDEYTKQVAGGASRAEMRVAQAAVEALIKECDARNALLGAALVDVLQKDYRAINALAESAKIIFPDGAPVVHSAALNAVKGAG